MEDLVGSFDGLGAMTSCLSFLGAPFGDPAEGLDEEQPRTGIYGACSVEAYRAAGALHAAHRDAGGFLDEVDRFVTPDYWRRDGAVKSWIYDASVRALADGRDMDAVRVFYHAGQGRMDEQGVFHLPMGALWSGADACISADQMRLGAQKLRYLFLSTSESMCISGLSDPMHNWARANAGLRMMFGFGSACWDSGRYGANFWRHWRMGKSFSQSWMDGALDVAVDQVPVVSACGASRAEAIETLFSERRFLGQRAGGQWWAWRWHEPLAKHPREAEPAVLPETCQSFRLLPQASDMALADRVLAALDFDPDLTSRDADGRIAAARDDIRFLRRLDGHILLQLEAGGPGRKNRRRVPLQRRAIVNRARSALRRYGFALPGSELVFDRITLAMSASSCLHMLGEPALETLDEIVVHFRQSISGMPILTPGAGKLRIAMSADGRVLRIESSLRQVAEAMPAGGGRAGRGDDPVPPGLVEAEDRGAAMQIDQRLARHSALLMRDLAARGAAPLNLQILPGTTEIGHGIRSNTARPVARHGIEIQCARGFCKRYWIQSDLGD